MKSDAVVSVKFYSKENGGRITPVPAHQYQCVFLTSETKGYDCRFIMSEEKILYPENTYELEVKFMDSRTALAAIKPLSGFRIWEGKVIGEGKLIKVL
ncbi:hypothetical protein [Endozoicomonas numazuensis]|uniref:Translation elongation factor EFTu/EF1A C-terminal domain-containing protein n=1 Tax=Endozoicomonas numazuensis TaxID=1137799 RepID=A0A081N6L9_9GAMM|nr:hypothetical protein [Endozoicomonas numazuensis]KEQ14092.1 hypothetical protein GZ78_26070 [Endozoicomonas numazuensis]